MVTQMLFARGWLFPMSILLCMFGAVLVEREPVRASKPGAYDSHGYRRYPPSSDEKKEQKRLDEYHKTWGRKGLGLWIAMITGGYACCCFFYIGLGPATGRS